MAILIATSTQKKVFSKSLITIGSAPDCDFKVNIGNSFLLIEFDGEFHERNSMDSHALALQKKRDSIKNEYCKECF